MKVLVAGGAGFIGSHLVKYYMKGNDVTVIDHLGSGANKTDGVNYIDADISNPLDIDCDLILHFASRASPPDYQAHPFDTINANTTGTYNLLKLAEKNDAKMVYASTSEIYGNPPKDQIPTKETYWGNVNSCGPRSCYDESKRLGETYCYEFWRRGVDIRVVRIFNTYGPGMRKDDGRVITNFLTQALAGKPLTIYGDGSQGRSYCFVDDLVEGITRVAGFSPQEGEFKETRVFNLGNPFEHYSVKELALIVKEITGSSSQLVYQGLPKDDPVDRIPDISKAMKVLGWRPGISLREGLKRTLESMK